MAAARDISVDAGVMAVLSELGGILTLKQHKHGTEGHWGTVSFCFTLNCFKRLVKHCGT